MSGFKLKLKVNTGGATGNPFSPSNTPIAATPATPAPLPTPGGGRTKLKFNTNKSVPSTPATSEPPKPKKSKAGRTTKPSAKIIESRKRPKGESDDEDAEDESSTIDVQQPAKKIKLSISSNVPRPLKTPATPGLGLVLKTKNKGKPPSRNPGLGYDSEASDREIDPVIEEEFILRMQPGEDCDYVRKAIEEKKIGGGADVSLKFFDPHVRRGQLMVRGNVYAATMVDLPCIIEGMKSWDKRGWWKSADICQMLWVYAKVDTEQQARDAQPPADIVANGFQFPHGLTPPMHHVRKLRFRKRLHKSVIERVEEEVNKLLQDDADAIESTFAITEPEDDRRASQFNGSTPGYDHDDEEDAEGEDDDDDQGYFNHQPEPVEEEEDFDADFEKEMEEALQEEANAEGAVDAATPSNGVAAETEEDSGDDSFDEDEDEGGDMVSNGVSEEEKARLARIQGIKEDIEELEANIRRQEVKLAAQGNALLQKRIKEDIRKLQQEIQLKKSSIGEDEGAEED